MRTFRFNISVCATNGNSIDQVCVVRAGSDSSYFVNGRECERSSVERLIGMCKGSAWSNAGVGCRS